MTTIYHNHLTVAGPKADLDHFIGNFRINEEMIGNDEVNDAAWSCRDWDDDGHQGFIQFIKEETGGRGRWDRIRMSRTEGGLSIAFDSSGGHAGSIVSRMAKNYPDLAFWLEVLWPPCSTRLSFRQGEWVEEEIREVARGPYGTYTDHALRGESAESAKGPVVGPADSLSPPTKAEGDDFLRQLELADSEAERMGIDNASYVAGLHPRFAATRQAG